MSDEPSIELSIEEVRRRLEQRIRATHVGELLRAQDATTVSLDEDGQIVEIRPDGTTRPYTLEAAISDLEERAAAAGLNEETLIDLLGDDPD
jgi:hypothetical protein